MVLQLLRCSYAKVLRGQDSEPVLGLLAQVLEREPVCFGQYSAAVPVAEPVYCLKAVLREYRICDQVRRAEDSFLLPF